MFFAAGLAYAIAIFALIIGIFDVAAKQSHTYLLVILSLFLVSNFLRFLTANENIMDFYSSLNLYWLFSGMS